MNPNTNPNMNAGTMNPNMNVANMNPNMDPNMDVNDWRTLPSPDTRQRIVNKIMDTLKKHLPISGPDGLVELKKIAVRFEEKIYTTATSQVDYLRKISLKMLTMEYKSQTTAPGTNSLPSNAAGGNPNPQDADI
ncbi:mediator of RNA polymerase II transcription subunit 15a-like [Aristolochia californica]|uniref:mediator of RNA polymerase II transcription subunit 15a-like n=1 Tax=Aristolochia californica TaxID=171875 RepID=UPI0035E05069